MSAILPVIIFQYVGFELQNGAGEEMHDPQRDVPRSIIRAGAVAGAAYVLFVVIILLAVPPAKLSNVAGFLAAFQAVTGVLPGPVAVGLGYLIALAFVITLASSGGTWIIGADRTYAISALDRTAPVLLGRFSGRYGTPIAVNTMSGIVATIAMVAAVVISEFFSGGGIGTLFSLVLGFTISTTTLSYLFIFPAFIILRYKYPDVRRPYKVPGGMLGAWIVTLLPLAYAVIASWFIVFPTDSAVKNVGVTRVTYELSQLIPLGIIVLLTIVFYVWGQSEKRNQDVVVELNTQTGAQFSTGAGGE